MEFRMVNSLIGKDEAHEVLSEKHWNASQKNQPPTSEKIFFLTREYIVNSCLLLNLPDEITQAASIAAELIGQEAFLRELAWHLHYCLFIAEDYHERLIAKWPTSIGNLGKQTDIFYFVVLISGLEKMRAFYKHNSLPAEVFKDTLEDIKRQLEEHKENNGFYGLNQLKVKWLQRHLTCRLFQLGRLQFETRFFEEKVRVFRHKDNKLVLALSENGLYYRKDGQLNGAGSVYEDNPWLAELSFSDKGITGYPLLPTGEAIPRETFLTLADWKQVLTIGDQVVYIHIPGGSPLSIEKSIASINAAGEFFTRYCPQRYKAFACNSWLLDNQLQKLLPSSSNIVNFQKEFYLLSIKAEQNGILKRIFGDYYDKLDQIKPKTTLERVALEHLAKGNHFRGGAGFLFAEDLKQGNQYYITKNMNFYDTR